MTIWEQIKAQMLLCDFKVKSISLQENYFNLMVEQEMFDLEVVEGDTTYKHDTFRMGHIYVFKVRSNGKNRLRFDNGVIPQKVYDLEFENP